MNTAIAEAEDPSKMATAMKLAIEAGKMWRMLLGRMTKAFVCERRQSVNRA
jgi:thiazole synthase ThiGH ThiG subunit